MNPIAVQLCPNERALHETLSNELHSPRSYHGEMLGTQGRIVIFVECLLCAKTWDFTDKINSYLLNPGQLVELPLQITDEKKNMPKEVKFFLDFPEQIRVLLELSSA